MICHQNKPKRMIHLHTVKWLQLLLCVTNDLIRQSFIYTRLNDKTLLFLTIQPSISQLFAYSLNG